MAVDSVVLQPLAALEVTPRALPVTQRAVLVTPREVLVTPRAEALAVSLRVEVLVVSPKEVVPLVAVTPWEVAPAPVGSPRVGPTPREAVLDSAREEVLGLALPREDVVSVFDIFPRFFVLRTPDFH